MTMFVIATYCTLVFEASSKGSVTFPDEKFFTITVTGVRWIFLDLTEKRKILFFGGEK